LTYDDDHYSPSLCYSDFQLFMRYLRRSLGPARFFCAGEYGETTFRPHFHCLLFGQRFGDVCPIGERLYRSPTLERLWPHGFSSIGEVTRESASYCAKYCTAKITGPLADQHYLRVDRSTGELVHVVPEFARMSLRPAIGYSWFQRYWRDVYGARDGVCQPGGFVVPAPRYYDRLLLELDSDLREWKDFERYRKSGEFAADCTPARLRVREDVALARIAHYKRGVL
jgi:hypothetical protein